uniref:SHSP domain-containing protein n=1 Tax=Leptocylindrus danicus TaxID=163516 RepID=A0A7S2JZN4_9STRA|mmetsp:Transcript_15006/g.22157  ORF Transcript_15006/g.22157 Transcript_15006/m.22157 type:complete len:210 (+) Transcript_15006:53-682(+)|eukprot:CAMPEP_0116033890 /NCGR_PEP_ID=MMETSP0321-20121206/19266_1 /TAXON_ID=163516 /ORGANISM="Leptocylindrus danicus var. danicus, Strain B650" /LENGTH=209 /DNA_ID=CAMNT_0003510067 /DNA_START=35 /DNA_END=664 /DNA_ORIENTATION=+
MPARALAHRGGIFHGLDDHFSLPFPFHRGHSHTRALEEVNTPTLTKHHPAVILRRSSPHFEVVEGEEEFLLAVDVKGIKPDDIDVHLEQGRKILRVSGRKKMHRADLPPLESRFDKTFTVSPYIDTSLIAANVHEGLLIVHCPKKIEKDMVNIPVTAIAHIAVSHHPDNSKQVSRDTRSSAKRGSPKQLAHEHDTRYKTRSHKTVHEVV